MSTKEYRKPGFQRTKGLVCIAANDPWAIYNFRKNLIVHLISEGFEVCGVSDVDDFTDKLKSLGCSFERVSLKRNSRNILSELFTLFSFLRCYARLRPDVVLNFNPKAGIYSSLACSLLGVPYINNISGLGRISFNRGVLGRFVFFLYKLSNKRAQSVLFQNPDDMCQLIKSGIVTGAQAKRVQGSGVDLKRFNFSVAPDDGLVKFVLVSRLIADKGIFEFAQAAKEIKREYENVNFYVLGALENGRGSIPEKFILDSHQQGVFTYLGTTDAVDEILREMDCVVLPSYYGEGVPRALLEGAAMGKPIVTTDNVGCREVVEEGQNGFLCAKRSVPELKSAMHKIIEMSHAERVSMGKIGRAKVENEFDEGSVISLYMSEVRRCSSYYNLNGR